MTNRDEFRRALLGFVNHPRVTADTPLFETGLIDSLAILNLIAVVEQATGRHVPARMVVMKHFRTIDSIVDTFGKEAV